MRTQIARNIVMFACCVGLMTQVSRAQDLHFSQWFNSPLTTNPANTGFIPDADYRLGANYRNQWSSIMEEPYTTMSVWGDAQVLRNKIENGWLGLGGVILRDQAGSGTLTSTEVYGSVAYHQMLGYTSLLRRDLILDGSINASTARALNFLISSMENSSTTPCRPAFKSISRM